MSENAGLRRVPGGGMDTGRARAMVDLGYAGLYLLALTAAHLWSAPALFVIALFVLLKIVMTDFNLISRDLANRTAGLLAVMSLGRMALLVICDVFWPKVIGLSFDLSWVVSLICVTVLVAGSTALVIAEQHLEDLWRDSGTEDSAPREVGYSSLPGMARWRIAANLACGRTSFEIEDHGFSYAVEAGDISDSHDTMVRRVLLVVCVLVITGPAFLYSLLRPELGLVVLAGGCAVVIGALALWVRAFRGRVALAQGEIRVQER